MMYLLYGTDTDAARAETRALLESFQKKNPDAALFRLEPEKWEAARLSELIGGQGLFERTLLIVADHLLENVEAKEAVLARLRDIAASDNIFLFLEGEVEKSALLEIADVAEKVQSFEKIAGEAKPEFNIFSLADALGRRDKKKLWVLYQKAIQTGAAPEEIHGVLFWQIKTMLLASAARTPEEAGVTPFPFRKAQQFLDNYSPDELRALSARLVALYHDAHRGIHDFASALERFVLTL